MGNYYNEGRECNEYCPAGRGGRCKPKYVTVYDRVIVTSMALIPRAKLNLQKKDRFATVMKAEMVLADWNRGGVFRVLPKDVLYHLLNVLLRAHGLQVRKKSKKEGEE